MVPVSLAVGRGCSVVISGRSWVLGGVGFFVATGGGDWFPTLVSPLERMSIMRSSSGSSEVLGLVGCFRGGLVGVCWCGGNSCEKVGSLGGGLGSGDKLLSFICGVGGFVSPLSLLSALGSSIYRCPLDVEFRGEWEP